MSLEIVKEIITKIEEHYGKMTVTHRKEHTYVGMDILFQGNREVKISMIDYLKECIIVLGEDCTGVANTPAGAHIFESNPDGIALIKCKRRTLHIIVAKLLFLAMRARPDILVPITFLSSRVTKVDKYYWKKLKRMLQYIIGTIDMEMTVSIDDMHVIKT